MGKLIEMKGGTSLIKCDNCSFKIESESEDLNESIKDIVQYLNEPCPDCGHNLLTFDDYMRVTQFVEIVNWVNKWFGWLSIFIPKSKYKTFEVNTHKEIKIKEKG